MELFPEVDERWPFIVSVVLCGIVLIQFFWILFFYARLAFHKNQEPSGEPPVSVIIAARNEEDNLFELLPFILEQDYPAFEVIVINHQSIDDSSHILKAFQRQYAHLKVIEISRNQHLSSGKKLPLTIAIKGAKYEHLLFTDADCKPQSDQWIRLMAGQFTEKKELILGYGPYRKEKGLLNTLIRLDTALIGMNYLSYAKAGIPFMGVGRNLAYTKSLFLNNRGFKSHYALQSGDDDLFIQETARKKNYSICVDERSFCYSEPKKTWNDWIKQKSRHFTTSSRYGVIKKLLLGIYPLSLILLYVSFITLLVNNWLSWIIIGTFGLILILKWIIQGMALKKIKENGFIGGFLVWDLFYALFIPIIYYTTEHSTEVKWK
ncbi:MAG: glycosyltransferase [Brumimicrobium sp.]|nr:glycosyltransferase [Brumimicrobium sp.]